MNTKILLFSLGSILIGLLSNCTPARQKRIEANPQIYQSLNTKYQQEVKEGKVSLGMPKEAVFLAWGKPNRVGRKTENGRRLERWSYTGYSPVVRHSSPYFYGYLYDYPYYDPYWNASYVEYIPYESKRVSFANDKVTEIKEGPYD